MSYKCPVCGAVSYHPHDERERYCGRCHIFADDLKLLQQNMGGGMVNPGAKTCKYCGRTILFNSRIRKWVTEKEKWKCLSDVERYPVRAHTPEDISAILEKKNGNAPSS